MELERFRRLVKTAIDFTEIKTEEWRIRTCYVLVCQLEAPDLFAVEMVGEWVSAAEERGRAPVSDYRRAASDAVWEAVARLEYFPPQDKLCVSTPGAMASRWGDFVFAVAGEMSGERMAQLLSIVRGVFDPHHSTKQILSY